jgi:HupE / UreJ protein
MIRILAAILFVVVTLPASAHKPSDAYLTLQRDGSALSGRWDIALRDLDNALTLDTNGGGEITWGEVRGKHAEIAAYAMDRLRVVSAGAVCPLTVDALAIDVHTDGAYAVLTLAGRCPQPAPTLAIDYRLLFDVDPQHRGLLNLIEHGRSTSIVFSVDNPTLVVGGEATGAWSQFAAYLDEGVWHIWLGFDHILFLLSLLLPAVLVRRDGQWRAAGSFRAAFVDVAKIVTAFTIAHSITLSLAVLGIVSFPSSPRGAGSRRSDSGSCTALDLRARSATWACLPVRSRCRSSDSTSALRSGSLRS